jgi:hypothetical protein
MKRVSAIFLNVDLDLHADKDLSPLVEGLETKLLLLHSSKSFASFELKREQGDIDDTLRALVAVVTLLRCELGGVG